MRQALPATVCALRRPFLVKSFLLITISNLLLKGKFACGEKYSELQSDGGRPQFYDSDAAPGRQTFRTWASCGSGVKYSFGGWTFAFKILVSANRQRCSLVVCFKYGLVFC